MLRLFISLAILGLSAVDPVGIGIMPVLLVQKHPYKRALIFLSGSFTALMLMGLVFAKGIGTFVLHFEHANSWFLPGVERAAGVILLCVATVTFMRLKSGKTEGELPSKTRKWLKLNHLKLFLLGGLIVAVQSVLDVVFVIAMVRAGQFSLSNLSLVAAVATYAVAALVIQIAVVLAFRLTPTAERDKFLARVQKLLKNYASQALVAISLILGIVLLALA
ncbi:MAG: hypothetical protein JWO47_869 [Candidatus Saccharibacteria bacterium]|nr:hypothetical protein [Candidatus Saccharibacteria bacterium]